MPTVGFSLPGVPFKLSAQEASGQPSYLDAITKGLNQAQSMRESAANLIGTHLKNKQAQLDIANNPLKQKLLQAQIARQSQLANQPFGGQLAGSAKEAYALEQLKGHYGEESPLYQNALRAYNANVGAKEALTDYRGALSKTADTRALTSFGKLQHEENDVLDGYEPGTNRQAKISPERQEELLGQYQLQRQKAASDADTRKKVLYATNIDKTVERINPKDLTKFGGIGGQLELKKQEGLSAANKPTSESYEKYKQAEANAKLLAKQVRQFYGESIQPSVSAKLEALTNPSTWRNNPRIAEQIYNSFVQTLKTETETYRSALKRPSAFQGQSNEQNDPLGIR